MLNLFRYYMRIRSCCVLLRDVAIHDEGQDAKGTKGDKLKKSVHQLISHVYPLTVLLVLLKEGHVVRFELLHTFLRACYRT